MIAIECGDHPGSGLLAIKQTSFTVPCSIHTDEHRNIEIEEDAASVFVHDSETTVTVVYMCAHEECCYTIQPENLGDVAREVIAASELVDAVEEVLDRKETVQWERVYPVQKKGETDEDYNSRKSVAIADSIARRKVEAESRTEPKDLIKGFKNVFGG